MDTALRSGCPINAAVEVLGDPWATLVLRDIMFGDRRHFRELIDKHALLDRPAGGADDDA